MKKILLCFFLGILTFTCGCRHINEIEQRQLVTACIVRNTDEKTNYCFYVSVPSGSESGDKSGSISGGKTYDFTADNFNEAIKLFEQSGQKKIDVSHMSLFAGDSQYFNDKFLNDEKYIRQSVLATSLIYACVYNGEKEELIECINNEYMSKPNEFTQNVLKKDASPFGCTVSELSLAANNEFYTGAIPALGIKKQGKNLLPSVDGAAIFSKEKNLRHLSDDEFTVYSLWRKKYKTQNKGYKLKINNKNLTVFVHDDAIIDIARKYALMDIDILNAKYHAASCFLNYNDYRNFFNNYNFMSVKYVRKEK